jgi:antitoxin component YwqK of YwqJK toxin-antitoxin module
VKYYPDSTFAEKLNYLNGIKHGEWIQYFPNGTVCLKANYLNGKLQGKFETYFTDGKPEFSGQYKNDSRDGLWDIYNKDGSLKYRIDYTSGIVKNPEMYQKESDYLDTLDKNKGKIAEPELTGVKWK